MAHRPLLLATAPLLVALHALSPSATAHHEAVACGAALADPAREALPGAPRRPLTDTVESVVDAIPVSRTVDAEPCFSHGAIESANDATGWVGEFLGSMGRGIRNPSGGWNAPSGASSASMPPDVLRPEPAPS